MDRRTAHAALVAASAILAATALAAATFLAPAAVAGEAEDGWTRYRGPNGQGVGKAEGLPVTWTDGDYLWKVELKGGGHSSPVVWGDRVFITSADQKTATRHIECFKASDGSHLWTKTYAGTPCKQNSLNAYAAPTPALDARRLYLTWATPQQFIVVAVTHDGKEAWRRDLGPWQSQHGYCGSPVVFEDMVILANDQLGPSSTVALDAATGAVRWQTKRESGKAAYSVPCIFRPPSGPPQLILTSTANGMTGLDPATGRVLWEVRDAMPERVVSCPVIADGLVFGTCGTGGKGRHVIAVRVPADGQAKAEVAWTVTDDAPYVPAGVVKDGLAFLWTENGAVSCIRTATGERVWSERLGGKFYASPILVGDRLYMVSTKGEVIILRAGEAFERLGQADLGEKSQATPAVAGGRMFLRTWSHLMALGAK